MIALLLATTIFVQRPGALQPGTGIVTGTLKVAGGSAAGIRVMAVDADDPTASSFLAVAETDAAGSFRLTNIPAGRYYIVAGRLNDPHYFPSGGDRNHAVTLVVEPAKVRSDVNFPVAAGSERPPNRTPNGTPTSAANTSPDQRELESIAADPSIDRKEKRLLEFVKKFPDSRVMGSAYLSLMQIYLRRHDTRHVLEFGEKTMQVAPNNVTNLVEVSRAYAILQVDTKKAVVYAERATTVAAQLKRPAGGDRDQWDRWVASLQTNAKANLEYVRRVAAWQQEQLLSLAAPRRAR